MLMMWLWGVYLFVIGLAFGSFALAMVDRMKARKDWVRERSCCEYCRHVLAPRDLIPLISWLSQRGRCRYCKKRLSVSYPLVELGLGLAFLTSFLFWPVELDAFAPIAQFIVWLAALVIMMALFVYDIRWFLLPNKLVYPLALLGVIWTGLVAIQNDAGVLGSTILAILVGAGVFLLLLIVSKGRWIGDGDVRLGLSIGLFTNDPLVAWFVIFAASLLGVLAAVPLLITGGKKSKRQLKIPFGPMLLVGLFIAVLFGADIVEWYRTDILLL